MAVCSSPSSPPALHLARLPEGTLEGPLQWTAVTASDSIDFDPAVCAALADIQVDTLQVGSTLWSLSKLVEKFRTISELSKYEFTWMRAHAGKMNAASRSLVCDVNEM